MPPHIIVPQLRAGSVKLLVPVKDDPSRASSPLSSILLYSSEASADKAGQGEDDDD
jgi:hypothetical protein